MTTQQGTRDRVAARLRGGIHLADGFFIGTTSLAAGVILLIILGAQVFGYFVTLTQVTQQLTAWVSSLHLAPIVVLVAILAGKMLLGSIMDQAAIIILAVPVVLILHNEEAAVVTKIEGVGRARKYHIRQTDGLAQELDYAQLSVLYLGYCWFIKRIFWETIRRKRQTPSFYPIWILVK